MSGTPSAACIVCVRTNLKKTRRTKMNKKTVKLVTIAQLGSQLMGIGLVHKTFLEGNRELVNDDVIKILEGMIGLLEKIPDEDKRNRV
jgi:hypothetical protein